jgi:hypothetical protein
MYSSDEEEPEHSMTQLLSQEARRSSFIHLNEEELISDQNRERYNDYVADVSNNQIERGLSSEHSLGMAMRSR